jgi:ADP-ribose pyrophosphatase YjhB (NUDIX family)
MEMNFCRRCGLPLHQLRGHVYRCDNGHTLYANCSPSVGVFILTPDDQVTLSVRGIEPHKGMLDAFGGFLDGEETVERAVARELEEELGLRPGDYSDPVYLTSGLGHYPFGGEVLPIISALFWVRLTGSAKLQPQDDVAGVQTIALSDIDDAKLHDDDIRIGIAALRRMIVA